MELLRPILFSERKPLLPGRYVIQTYSGMLLTKRWLPEKRMFTRVDNSQIYAWFKSFDLPSAEDMQHVVGDRIPMATHPSIRAEQLRGVRMAMESLAELIKKV